MANADRYYLGKEETLLDNNDSKEKLVHRLRQYLDLRNVSLLIGNGASIPFGAPRIGNIAALKDEFQKAEYQLESLPSQTSALTLLDVILKQASGPVGVEPMLGLLSHLQADIDVLGSKTSLVINDKSVSPEDVQSLERLIKKWLYLRCRELSTKADDNSLKYHRELFRRFLLRSTSLPRLKTFTTNYDLLVEAALDSLGVAYFDGFLGTMRRSLRTESYHYDLYFPGETTEGRVSRVDRVLQMCKLHGSINWRRAKLKNHFDIVMENQQPGDSEYGNVMVYPSPLKNTEMHGYPYSEMFRHFSTQIHQPQSVLFTVGYAFNDEHVNRIIYQALSIPSFELVIILPKVVEPTVTESQDKVSEVWRLINEVASKRILVITGGETDGGTGYAQGLGTLKGFSMNLMPDIKEMAIEEKVKQETEEALSGRQNQEGQA
jgi:hypothetical protein